MSSPNSAIKIKNLSKRLGKFSLEDIHLHLVTGEYLVILGPSGSGKTSLLECIAGIKTPDRGEIWAHGQEISQWPIEKRDIGFVYQRLMLFPHMTVSQNVLYGLTLRRDPQKKKKSLEILEILGVAHLQNRPVLTLSGGEQQRVALARALVIRPQILLLDEPLNALDPMAKNRSIELLKNIWRELGQTIIHVTHDHFEAMNLATQIGVMNEGKLIQVDSVQNIFQKPANRFIAEFTCAENVFEGEGVIQEERNFVHIENSSGKIVRIQSQEKRQGKVNLFVNPANIFLSRNGQPGAANNEQNILKGQVISVKDLNQMIKLTVDVGIPFTVNLTKQIFVEMDLKPGSEISLSFQPSSIHLF